MSLIAPRAPSLFHEEIGPVKALVERADSLAVRGRKDEALRLYERALELEPQHAGGHLWLKRGHLLYRIGRYAEAIESYREATRHARDDRGPQPSLCMASALERLGRLDAAICVLEDYLAGKSQSSLRAAGRALGELARLLVRAGRMKEASRAHLRAAHYDKACGIDAGDHFLFDRNDVERARDLYESHPAKDSDPALLARRAVVASLCSDEALAAELWAKAVHLDHSVAQFAKLWTLNHPDLGRVVTQLVRQEDTVPCGLVRTRNDH